MVKRLQDFPDEFLIQTTQKEYLQQAEDVTDADRNGTSDRGDNLKLREVLVYWVAKMAGWTPSDSHNKEGDAKADRILGRAKPSVYIQKKDSFLRKGTFIHKPSQDASSGAATGGGGGGTRSGARAAVTGRM